jgi:hypothetical protein
VGNEVWLLASQPSITIPSMTTKKTMKTMQQQAQSRTDADVLLVQMRSQNHLLRIGLGLLCVVTVGIALSGAKSATGKASFDEIDVGRINIVGADGVRSMVLAARGLSPQVVTDGKVVHSEQPRKQGMFFYNDVGDEVGGLIYSGKLGPNGKPVAGVHLSMDRFGGDQQLALHHYEDGGFMETGLSVYDRGLHKDYGELYQQYLAAPEGEQKQALLERWKQAGGKQITRLFVGRSRGKSPALVLADPQGRPRIMMLVDGDGSPRLDFLDAHGEVLQSLPQPATAQ